MNYQILTGDNRKTLKTLADDSIDAIITDPPYGIDFLGKSWDANTGALETYQQCLRVLKPGGHILAFSAARTYHHLAITLEQAGFEIRDQIMWIYSSGFPKSQDIGKSLDKKSIDNNWSGWGTALKPAHEPIALARKPIKGSIRDNCLKWGVGALNIDATRIERDQEAARFPSNVLGDIPDYQKYFYCPKVSRKERHIGFDSQTISATEMVKEMGGYFVDGDGKETTKGSNMYWVPHLGVVYGHGLSVEYDNWHKANGTVSTGNTGNNHPTVKPIALMKYLIKLIAPPGGTVLDPFNGSGSTGCAAVELGHTYIGCELDENYVKIAHKRIQSWYEHTLDPAKDIFDDN